MLRTRPVLTWLAALVLCACGSSSAASPAGTGGAAEGGSGPPEGGGGSDAGGEAGQDAAPGDAGVAGPDAGKLVTTTYGGRQVLVYVGAKVSAQTPAPLVLMLHGCTQSPTDFAAGTRMNAQADAAGFVVVYPDEPTSANPEKCWNWFLPSDQARGAGEPGLLAGIVADVQAAYRIDPKRVFVAGLSSGAAMAVILGATYPDVFSAIGVHSGLEYAAATDVSSALSAQASGGPDPKKQGDAAFAAMGARAASVPAIVFQGDADTTVAPTNGAQVVAQWAETDTKAGVTPGPAQNGSGSAGGATYTHTTYAAAGGNLLELYLVHGLGHAWSGGSTAGTFTDPGGPDASALIWQFFAAHGR